MPQFVTFGDSITQRGFAPGWTSALADAYQRRADVVNRGYSGACAAMRLMGTSYIAISLKRHACALRQPARLQPPPHQFS